MSKPRHKFSRPRAAQESPDMIPPAMEESGGAESLTLPTNLGIHRQDAKFAKVDILTRKPQFPWHPWRLGGEFFGSYLPCHTRPPGSGAKRENENSMAAHVTTDYAGFNGFHGEYDFVLSKSPVTLQVHSLWFITHS